MQDLGLDGAMLMRLTPADFETDELVGWADTTTPSHTLQTGQIVASTGGGGATQPPELPQESALWTPYVDTLPNPLNRG